MGQRAAKRLHIALSVLGAALYFLFVIPRWWVLIGDIPATLGTVGRIATGLPIAAAAIPVMLTLRRSLDPELETPELALRLRAWSAVLHAVAGGLLIVTALVEIWLPLQKAGPWLFAVYGAAGAVAILAIAAFHLSFVAEQPPAPPKPKKAKKQKAQKQKAEKAPRQRRLGRKRAGAGEASTEEQSATEADGTGEAPATEADGEESTPVEKAVEDAVDEASAADESDTQAAETPAAETDSNGESGGGLKNIRPTGKRRHRLRR